jgi:zinc transport system substrate-binding protein
MRPPSAALAVLLLALSGCAGSSASGDTGSGPVRVSAGFYPYAFVAERVGGPDVAVTNLTEPGGEPHDLELTPQQVGALGESDLVVYSEGFQPAVDEAVEQQAADRALDVLSVVELHEGAEHTEGGAEHEHGGEDPHVWLDPDRLSTIAGAVADRLAEADPDHEEGYRERAKALQDELAALDQELRSGLSSCARTQIVTSHDAFGYLADAYGLEQVAVAGLTPEDEASPRRLAEVAADARAAGVTTVFHEELGSPAVAESLAREIGATTAVLRTLEGAPDDGDYLTAMRDNLERLRTALDCR